jgi:predicted nucleic acid-binding protein
LTIIDTTYLLPLAQIRVDADLLVAVAEERSSLRMSEMGISLISLFELQAKAAKLRVPSNAVDKSIKSILETFTIVPFTDSDVVEASFGLRKEMTDYIDCVIAGTAASRGEDLVSEDSKIWKARSSLHEKYGIEVLRYRDVVETSPRGSGAASGLR